MRKHVLMKRALHCLYVRRKKKYGPSVDACMPLIANPLIGKVCLIKPSDQGLEEKQLQ